MFKMRAREEGPEKRGQRKGAREKEPEKGARARWTGA
jgi:hypothetical protein